MPHEKVTLDVLRQLHGILNPSKDPIDVRKLHQQDEKAKWFAVVRDNASQIIFEDYGRYAALISDIARSSDIENRYPKMVSFVGVTNAGKSTLINMLVQRTLVGENQRPTTDFPSPVVGCVADDSLATSGDVHLYADPASHLTPLPILFADCEGFEGGERSPLGSRYYHRSQHGGSGTSDAWINTRSIKWADREEYRRREYAVNNLYPRLLYSFSDCVVFVLRNPKTFGSAALTKLLDWGAAALEKSMNQPALPHCVVTLNGSHPAIATAQWDVEHATRSLLLSVSNAFDCIEGVPQFCELAKHWRELGREINTVEDLILCYYASFKVVRVPAEPRYTLMSQQVEKLYATIQSNCERSHEAKIRTRLLTNAEELDQYLQSGFDHFTLHIDVPFNFMQVSLTRNPISQGFGGHILQLCETLNSRLPSREPTMMKWTFRNLSNMLASCVLLDCARFHKGELDKLFANYKKFFEYAMTEYLELQCPCSYVSSDGTRSCKLVKARHWVKGHQDEKGIIAAGEYLSGFDDKFAEDWTEQLETAIQDLHRIYSRELGRIATKSEYATYSEERVAFAMHLDHLHRFYQAIGPATWVRSNSTCFCCLMDVPQHPLPCGHALCDRCARACGVMDQSTLVVSWCPLHRDVTHWAQPTIIKYKPREAGVRILALDGGGIRGVVQLEILRAVEQALGNHFEVQSFFDLIVGTGTGGLIAVMLAKQGSSVQKCQNDFNTICKRVYTTNASGGSLINRVVRAFGSRRESRTSSLYGALKSQFTDSNDFFGTTTQFRPDTRVGVTATSATRHKTILLSNYRRKGGGTSTYDYERPHDPAMELKSWQAAYATMADPQYFAPLCFGKQYSGGRSTCANPAPEARIEANQIWPEVEEPDLLLSIGTGQNRKSILKQLKMEPTQTGSSTDDAWFRESLKKAQNVTRTLFRGDNDVLDAERVWRHFTSAGLSDPPYPKRRRYVRFNIDLGMEEPPAQDRESQTERLSELVRDKLQEDHRLAMVTNVAHRLVASSFYFHTESRLTGPMGEQFIEGHIYCRFEDNSDNKKQLGKLLNDRCKNGFQPFFSILSTSERIQSRISLTFEKISHMIRYGVLNLPKVSLPAEVDGVSTSIRLHLLEHDELEPKGYPISGNPLWTKDSANHLRSSCDVTLVPR